MKKQAYKIESGGKDVLVISFKLKQIIKINEASNMEQPNTRRKNRTRIKILTDGNNSDRTLLPNFEAINFKNILTTDAQNLQDYLVISNANHQRNVKVTAKEILYNFMPLLVSYGVGGIATLAYIGASQNAATNKIDYYLNPIGAVVLNGFVNGYFFHAVVSTLWNGIFQRNPRGIRKAIANLHDYAPGVLATITRGMYATGRFLFILGPAFLSAYPLYALDKTESDDPEFIADLVLLSTTMLQYKGVEAIINRAIPTLTYPIKAAYRRYNKKAKNIHEARNILNLSKEAHRSTLISAHKKLLELAQTDQESLADIYTMLENENPSLEETAQLLYKVCQLANTADDMPPTKLRTLVQILSLIITTASLPGYFLKTKVEAAKFLNVQGAAEWIAGSAIYFVSAALSYDVAWDVFGNLYDLTANACHGIKKCWDDSTSVFDFAKRAWQGKSKMASWASLIRFPFAIQQNPKLMLSTLGLLYVLSYWSTSTSNYLNEQQLGAKISQHLVIPTIIAVIAFNAYPVDKVLASIQQFFTRLVGIPQHQSQIRLEQFILNQIQLLDTLKGIKFSQIIRDIAENTDLNDQEKEKLFLNIFGNKTPVEVFEKHNIENFQGIIPLLTKEEQKLSKHRSSFFANKNYDEEAYPINLSYRSPGFAT
jgi:hypothetical protein